MTRVLASVEVPASSANLGSGFDVFAAALSLRLRAELHPAWEAGIEVVARGEGAVGAEGAENLVARSFREGLRATSGTGGSGGWRIEVSSMIPSARGLGSSAAAILAGLLLGIGVGRRRGLPLDEVLALAARIEGHPDNVAAALHGGITLAVADAGGNLLVRRIRAPESWIPVVFVPQAESHTVQMRGALPVAVPHHDAALHGGRAALLATAFLTGDASLLPVAMDDRIHQPYRLPLLEHAAGLIELAYERGAAGAALSGAGPSVLAICDGPAAAHAVEKAFAQSGLPGAAMRLRFDAAGARVTLPDSEEAPT